MPQAHKGNQAGVTSESAGESRAASTQLDASLMRTTKGKQMTDEIKTAEQLQYEAAKVLDHQTGKGYWSGEASKEAQEFVEMILQAATLRAVAAMRALLDSAEYGQHSVLRNDER